MSSYIEVQRICECCSQSFIARTTKTRYCSKKCNTKAYKSSVKDLKVEISNMETAQIIAKPMDELKAKPFLSINETSQLIGISRRTIYRLLERGELNAGKVGRRTIIQRKDIDNLFIKA